MLPGSAVTDVSLSLRLFTQAHPRFSLQQRGCPGKEDFAPCGYITLCCGDQLRQAAAASLRPDYDFPKNAVLSQRACPGKEAFALMRVSPTVLRILGSGKQQQQPTEPTLISQPVLCFRRGFQLGANRTSLLLPQQGFGRSLCYVREEELRESWCLLALACPGFIFEPCIHPAKPK